MDIKKSLLFLFLGLFLFSFVLVSADIISINSGGGEEIVINPSTEIEGFFSYSNIGPDIPTPILTSLDGSNESDINLNCSFVVEDVDSNYLNISVSWVNNTQHKFFMNYTNVSNSTTMNVILDEGNLTLGETWMCSVQFSDLYENSNWGNSNNLTIIDITDPEVYIVSPNASNYTFIEINFNVTLIENELTDLCFYSIDEGTNLSMNQFNSTYYWEVNDSLSPGDHNVTFYCNDTSDNWGSNFTNFTILDEAAISILLSDELLWGVKWNVFYLPANDLDANGNNDNSSTDYFINISAVNTLVDLYVKADGNLTTSELDTLDLENENYSVSTTDSTVNKTLPKYPMTTNYTLIASDLGDNVVVFMKFYLDSPGSQPAGVYENSLFFKAVKAGESV